MPRSLIKCKEFIHVQQLVSLPNMNGLCESVKLVSLRDASIPTLLEHLNMAAQQNSIFRLQIFSRIFYANAIADSIPAAPTYGRHRRQWPSPSNRFVPANTARIQFHTRCVSGHTNQRNSRWSMDNGASCAQKVRIRDHWRVRKFKVARYASEVACIVTA